MFQCLLPLSIFQNLTYLTVNTCNEMELVFVDNSRVHLKRVTGICACTSFIYRPIHLGIQT